MAGKKKTVASAQKKLAVPKKKATAKKANVNPETASATRKKIARSPKTPKTEEVAKSKASTTNSAQTVGERHSEADSRTQYEKLVKPQNYFEYMQASNFRGNR